MDRARIHEGIRRMRCTDVLGRSERSELSQMEAAELLGISERTFRRWRDRHRDAGLEGLDDRRLARRLASYPQSDVQAQCRSALPLDGTPRNLDTPRIGPA